MAKITPYRQEAGTLERLEHELQAERQQVKDACFRVARIDADAEPSRYEALVSAMLDALDRQMARDAAASPANAGDAQPDLFDGIALESEALNTLIAHLRCLSTGDEKSSDRYQVLSNYVNGHRQLGRTSLASPARQTSIDWEDLGNRMDAMRERIYSSEQECRSRQEQKEQPAAARPGADS